MFINYQSKKVKIMNSIQVTACKEDFCVSAKFNGNALLFFLLGVGTTIVAINYYETQKKLNK